MANRTGTQRKPTKRTAARRGTSPWAIASIALVVLIAGVLLALWLFAPKPVEQPHTQAEDPQPAVYEPQDVRVERMLDELTLEQRVAQLFIVQPEALTGVEVAVKAGEATRDAIAKYPVGGLCYFAANLQDRKQTEEMLRNTQNYAKDACGLPMFLCVDEEGGTVVRVADNENFEVENPGSMADIGATGDIERARQTGFDIGTYLKALGFNVDFAPVADVVASEASALYGRSFGSDPEQVGAMVSAEVEGLKRSGVLCVAKHFPGIGDALGDSHEQSIFSDRTADEMATRELVPFQAAIAEGVPMVMVGHLTCNGLHIKEASESEGEGEAVAVDEAAEVPPACFDAEVIQGLLRGRLGYNGLVISDSLQMDAAEGIEPIDQGVRALEAGVDIILMPSDFQKAYKGVLNAVRQGRLSEERINESVKRIIDAKLTLH